MHEKPALTLTTHKGLEERLGLAVNGRGTERKEGGGQKERHYRGATNQGEEVIDSRHVPTCNRRRGRGRVRGRGQGTAVEDQQWRCD